MKRVMFLNQNYSDKLISVSNGIITYDLIKKINEENELLNQQQ